MGCVPGSLVLVVRDKKEHHVSRNFIFKGQLHIVIRPQCFQNLFLNPTSALYLPIWGKFPVFAAESRVISRGAFRFGLK